MTLVDSDNSLSAIFQIQAESHSTYNLNIKLYCPVCQSTHLVKNGFRPRINGSVQQLECMNKECPAFHASYPLHGKQFTISTSGEMQYLIKDEIQRAYDSLYHHSVRSTEVARTTEMSDAWVSFLRKELDAVITRGLKRDEQIQPFCLVSSPTADEAASVDETFFKIKNKTVYVIIIRGYLSRKVLAIFTSFSRKESDIAAAFQEAEKNCQKPIQIMTADAWGATELMIRHLNRPITLIMHRHKRPYDKAVIERIEYKPEQNIRMVTQIGVSTDIFRTRATHAAHYLQRSEPLQVPIKESRPKGRPKGMKDKKPRKRKNQNSETTHLPSESAETNDDSQKKSADERDSF